MYLTGLIQRDRLFDIASRWFAGRVAGDDGRQVTEIFAFERIITAPAVRSLITDLARVVERGSLQLTRVLTKDAVRQAIAAMAGDGSPRSRELVQRYTEVPEEFFPRTPVYISLVTGSRGQLVAMVRRKRIRRIAEKVSRKVADQLDSAIVREATERALARAGHGGARLVHLVSSREVMVEDFCGAERAVAERFRTLELSLDRTLQRVDDVVGVKLVVTQPQQEAVEQLLHTRGGTSVVEREVHQGRYRGLHLLVELELPCPADLVAQHRQTDWTFVTERGLDPSEAQRAFTRYVETAHRSFAVELILTSFDDLVESELGSSIHEARILEQRHGPRYTGRIAQNASYIVEYLLCVALSPETNITELPVKMWGRYLPDTLASAVQALTHGHHPEWLLPPDEPTVMTLVEER